MEFFSFDIFLLFSHESNCFHALIDPGKEIIAIKKETKEFSDVSIMLRNLKFPQICMYWGSSTRVPLIPDTINVKRYFKLQSNLHVVSQRKPENNDQFWKIKTDNEDVQKTLQLPLEEHNSIDDQMIPFIGRMSVKHFNQTNKPKCVGIKKVSYVQSQKRLTILSYIKGKVRSVSHPQNIKY